MGFFNAMGLSAAATLGATSVADDVLDLRDEDTKRAKILAVRSAEQYKQWSYQADKLDSDLINIGQAAANAGGETSQAFFKSLSPPEQKGASLDFKARRTLDRDIDPAFFFLLLQKKKEKLGEGVPLYEPGVKSDEEEALAQKDAAYEPPGFFSRLGSIARGEADSDTPRKAALSSGYVKEDEVAAALRGDRPPRQSVVASPLGETVVNLRPLNSREKLSLEILLKEQWQNAGDPQSTERQFAIELAKELLEQELFTSNTYNNRGTKDEYVKTIFADILRVLETRAGIGKGSDFIKFIRKPGTVIEDVREFIDDIEKERAQPSNPGSSPDNGKPFVWVTQKELNNGGPNSRKWFKGLNLKPNADDKYGLTKEQYIKLQKFHKEKKPPPTIPVPSRRRPPIDLGGD